MIINDKRALAHIQLVHDIRPIEGADNIELVHVLGWTLIALKGEFKEGDKAVYIEIDSQVPASDSRFEFLKSKHYKIKTMKLNKFKVISQGLALPLSSFPELGDADVNTDVTEALNIVYAVPEDNYRKANDLKLMIGNLKAIKPKLFRNRIVQWLAKREWGRKFILKVWGRKTVTKTGFPSQYCSKTDEERVQNMPWVLENKNPFVVTEKIDGTSSTYVLAKRRNLFGRIKYEFIVSSRNVRQLSPDQVCYHEINPYWEMAEKYDIEAKMKEMLKELPKAKFLVLQGETYGDKLQGNPYNLKERRIAFFNLIDSESGKWGSVEAKEYLGKKGLPFVPIIKDDYVLPDTVDELLEAATGTSTVSNVLREGWVLRQEQEDGTILSFKSVSPEYLIKHKE